jgi:hypothetical protein
MRAEIPGTIRQERIQQLKLVIENVAVVRVPVERVCETWIQPAAREPGAASNGRVPRYAV